MAKLLAPVTNFEGVVGAVRAGADEIYCGVKIAGVEYVGLSTRPSTCSLSTYDELGKIVRYAHDHGVKALVTTELPFMTKEIEKEIKNSISCCVEKGIDALIASDIGILLLAKDMNIGIPIYASTYLASMNYEAVEFLKKLGAKRVVLERHVAIDEVKEIVERCKDVEIEVFVHGPGCSNINVNCYGCTEYVDLNVHGPPTFAFTLCRLPYDIYKIREDAPMKVGSEQILDAFSFCSLCHLPALVQTGVNNFKIVGRGAPAKFVEETTRIYRELLDLIENNQLDLFQKKLESFKSQKYSASLPPNSCVQKRCYYMPFFHAPYKIPISPSSGKGAEQK